MIEVNVPEGGLNRYHFMGIGYRHGEYVPDRRKNWPVARGIPLPKGAVLDVEELALYDEQNNMIPRQVRSLAVWKDGSVMFVHIAWQADVAHDVPAHFKLELAGGENSPEPKNAVSVQEADDSIAVSNGPLSASIGTKGDHPSMSLAVNGKTVFDGDLNLWTIDNDDQHFRGTIGKPEAVRVVESGPLVGIVEITGQHHSGNGDIHLDYVLRLRFDAGIPRLHVSHQFINMGDEPEGVEVGEIGFGLPEIKDANLQHIVAQTYTGLDSFYRFSEFPEDVDISIPGTRTRIADTKPLREDTTGYPDYVMKCQDMVAPWIGLRTNDWSAVTFIHEVRENWPKRMVAQNGRLDYHLWPKGYDLQNLRQGMAKTHSLEIFFFDADAAPLTMHTHQVQSTVPANVSVPFEWYQHCEVFGMQYTMSWMPKKYPLVEAGFMACAERSWAVGMLDYGDDPNSGYTAGYNLVSGTKDVVWINNEHDYMSQAIIQYWRSNRPAAWLSGRVSAQHQIDVDFVRRSDDPWKVGGIPAHCYSHTTAAVYPSHTWTEGLLQYYVTSGDDRALDVAKSLGDNLCKYVNERYQILETESRMEGWALIALDALIEITHEEKFLKAVREIERHIADVVKRTGGYDVTGLGYGTGTVFTGLANLHRITGDDSTLKLLLTIIDWHIEHQPQRVPNGRISDIALLLPGFAYAYHVTGDDKYRDTAIGIFLHKGAPAALTGVRGSSKNYRTYVPFLKVAHDAGILDEIEMRLRIQK